MNVGKTLFVQVMEFVPLKTFGRIIEQHKGDAGGRALDCADLFRIMAFAQLTWRESLRDIEVCLTSIDFARLYAMHQAGAFFVIRAKAGIDARRVYSTLTDRASGVICESSASRSRASTRRRSIRSICDAFDSKTQSRARR
jgi:hypothetical protein